MIKRKLVTRALSVTLLLLAGIGVLTAAAAPSLILQIHPGTPIGQLAKKYRFEIVRGIQSTTRGPAFVITGNNLEAMKQALALESGVEWVDENARISILPMDDSETLLPLDGGENVVPLDGGENVLPLGPGIQTVDKPTIVTALKTVLIRLDSGEYVLPLDEQTVMTLDQLQTAYQKLADLVVGSPAFLLQPSFGRIAFYGAVLRETGKNMIIASLDSGVDTCHEVLQGTFVRSFVENGADAPENCPTPATIPVPAYGHGTEVASLLRVMAPEATIWGLRVFDSSGSGDVATVYEAAVWATNHGANVINMSFGSSINSLALQNAVAYAASRGVILSGAGGNAGIDQAMYPADTPPTIGTAATDAQDKKATFSNYNDAISVSAPGVKLVVAYPGHQYAVVSGTSFASPLVGGEAAMTSESWNSTHHGPGVTDFVRAAMLAGVDDVYSPNPSKFLGKLGSGRINLWKAYQRIILP